MRGARGLPVRLSPVTRPPWRSVGLPAAAAAALCGCRRRRRCRGPPLLPQPPVSAGPACRCRFRPRLPPSPPPAASAAPCCRRSRQPLPAAVADPAAAGAVPGCPSPLPLPPGWGGRGLLRGGQGLLGGVISSVRDCAALCLSRAAAVVLFCLSKSMCTRSSRSCVFDSLVCGYVLPAGAGAQWQYTTHGGAVYHKRMRLATLGVTQGALVPWDLHRQLAHVDWEVWGQSVTEIVL
mgnify:CR=1 FL=1